VTDGSSREIAIDDWPPHERSDSRNRRSGETIWRQRGSARHFAEPAPPRSGLFDRRIGLGQVTLLRCVNLLETIDGGTITLFGQSLTDVRIDPGPRCDGHTGMVFQSFNLFPHLSVLENVLVGPVRALKRKRSDVIDEALQLLERIGLRNRATNTRTDSRAVNSSASPSCDPSR